MMGGHRQRLVPPQRGTVTTATTGTGDRGMATTTATTATTKKAFFTTPNPFELKFGYHRAVRRGPFIFVSGTTALKEVDPSAEAEMDEEQQQQNSSKVYYPTDARMQARIAMERCVEAVEKLGGKREDVVRVKMFVAHHRDSLEVGAAFHDCFATDSESATAEEQNVGGRVRVEDEHIHHQQQQQQQQPTSEVGATATMIMVQNGFIDPDILVEVEVDAVIVESNASQ